VTIQDCFSPNYWQKERATISPSWVSVEIPRFHSVKYLVNLWNETENKNKFMEIVVVKNGSLVDNIISNRVGNAFNVSIDAVLTGNKLHLAFTTTETYPINVELLYVVIG